MQQDGDDCASELRARARSVARHTQHSRQAEGEGLGVGRCFRGSRGQSKALLRGAGEEETVDQAPGWALSVAAAGAGSGVVVGRTPKGA